MYLYIVYVGFFLWGGGGGGSCPRYFVNYTDKIERKMFRFINLKKKYTVRKTATKISFTLCNKQRMLSFIKMV